ncbi:MAG: GtrA family protein [Actinomycetota bacterium]|nr:GtrA family protein [Actinomycetota bacterium]
MQERFVFRDLRDGEKSFWRRGVTFLASNNAEALVRLPVLAALVSGIGLAPLLAQGLTLATAFVLRFVFVSQVVYRPPDDRLPFPKRTPRAQAPRNP